MSGVSFRQRNIHRKDPIITGYYLQMFPKKEAQGFSQCFSRFSFQRRRDELHTEGALVKSVTVYAANRQMATSNLHMGGLNIGDDGTQPLDPPDGARTTVQLHTRRSGQNIALNQYDNLKRIGSGQHGEVFVAYDTTTGKQVVSALFPQCLRHIQ